MYNGIGLTTARGSGTNGFVQRNLAFVHVKKEKTKYHTEEDIAKHDAFANRKPNLDILDHERKRKMELKCLELREVLEEQGFAEDEIEVKLTNYRTMLVERSEKNKDSQVELDEYGRPIARDTHELAAATQERNLKLRDAFGVTADFIEGSSFDPNRKAKSILKEKEAKAKEMAEKNSRYGLVRSPLPEVAPEPTKVRDSSPRQKHKKEKREKGRSERSKKHRRRDSSSEDVSDIDRSDDERRDRGRKRHRHDKDKKRSEIPPHSPTELPTTQSNKLTVSIKDIDKLPLSPPRSSRSPTPAQKSRSPSRASSHRSKRSSSRSRSRSYESRSRSRSRSRSYSRSRSRSRSYSRSRSRSPSIPRRPGSPSFLDKRRITSARKRPIPYHRPTPSPYTSDSESDYSRYRLSLSRSRSRSRSASSERSRRSYTPSNHIFASRKMKIWRTGTRSPSGSPKRNSKKGNGSKRSPVYN